MDTPTTWVTCGTTAALTPVPASTASLENTCAQTSRTACFSPFLLAFLYFRLPSGFRLREESSTSLQRDKQTGRHVQKAHTRTYTHAE